MRVKTSGLGRSIKDYLWYLATLEWIFFYFLFGYLSDFGSGSFMVFVFLPEHQFHL